MRTFASSCAAAILAGAVVASVGPSTVLGPTATVGSAVAPHIMVVVMENHNYSEVIGQGDQPYTNMLATNYGLATQAYAVSHPSLPNYIDLVSGHDPANATDDGPPSAHTYTYTTIADQLRAAGISAKAYAEDLPADPTNDSGEYAVRHFPWEYFPHSTAMPISNSTSLVSDLNGTNPPSYVWYTPNLINDEHDGTVAQGDAFLSSFIPSVQGTNWYKTGGQIIITWDESDNDNTNGGGRIPTIVVSAALKASPTQSSTEVNTTGILNSIEDSYGLAHLGTNGIGTIDSLLGTTSGSSQRSITNAARASAAVGTSFTFSITTTGTPAPRLKKHGRLPKGLRFRNNHNGTATIWGTPNPHKALGTDQVTIVATYGRGKTKQVVTQVFTLTVT